MTTACPRCNQTLEHGELRQVPVEACRQCKGTLVAQLDLPRLLEALSAPLLRGFDLDAKLEAVKDASTRIQCPSCQKAMDRDDYCSAGLVAFDRCNACSVLWFDADELGGMALMWARMNARQTHEQALNLAAAAISTVVVVHGDHHRCIDRDRLGDSVWTSFLWI